MTGGLLGPRDPAQPLLTYLDGPARVELSGSTTANWVAKTANLLTDSYDAPDRVGLLLPLHWQTVCLLLGAVTAGSTAVVAGTAEELAGCAVAFTSVDQAVAALDAGVEDVLACSLTPFATPVAELPAMVLDAARELPGHGDHFGGRPSRVSVELAGHPFAADALDLTPSDRVLTALPPATPAGLGALLGVLQTGAALILLADGDRDRALSQESATAWVDEAGLHRCGG